MRLLPGCLSRGLSAARQRPWLVVLALLLTLGWPQQALAQSPGVRWSGSFEVMSSGTNPAPNASLPANQASGVSRHPLTADGRYVVFDSTATNLGGGTIPSLYRKDRRTGQTTVLYTSTQARNVAISADGNHIAFELCSTICQIYAKDLRVTAAPVLMSVSSSGATGNGDSTDPVLSANGRFLVFATKATNLSSNAAPFKQVIVRDRDTDVDGIYDEPGTVLLQTASQPNGVSGGWGTGDSDTGEISDDGRYVAFRSVAPNLVASDTNGVVDVFLRDRQSLLTRRLNVREDGSQSPDAILEPRISLSADGRFVAFASGDSLLVTRGPADTNGTLDVFVFDRLATPPAASLSRIDVGRALGGVAQLGNGPSGWPTLNADGRYVFFQSAATNTTIQGHSGVVQVYAVDRAESRLGWISGPFEAFDSNQPSVSPTVSADGSVVVFKSAATNLYLGFQGPAGVQEVVAASAAILSPNTQTIPSAAGASTLAVSAQTHTRWQGSGALPSWVTLQSPSSGVGGATLTFAVDANPTTAFRSFSYSLFNRGVVVNQEPALSLTSFSPVSGPMSGGTTVTIRGNNYVPGMRVYFGTAAAAVTFVDSTTLSVMTPPSLYRQPVVVTVERADGSLSASSASAFTFLDDTPPTLIGTVAGPQGRDGWIVGNALVTWYSADPQSAVTRCPDTVMTQDTAGTTVSCTVDSEGGSTTSSVTVKRDATPPVVTFTAPAPRQLVDPGAVVASAFTCSDGTSGVAACGMSAPTGSPLATAAAGWYTFTTDAMDQAGNIGTGSVEYAVATGLCAPPAPGLTTWLRFEGDLLDVMGRTGVVNSAPPDVFVSGRSGQAYRFVPRTTGALLGFHGHRLDFSDGMSVALWLRPEANTTGYLVHNYDQYRIQRNSNGTITWYLYRETPEPHGSGTSTTAVPLNAWTHVVLTFDAGTVTLYLNGRVDQTWTVPFTALKPAGFATRELRIGGDDVGPWGFVGALDELQLGDRAITAAEVEALYLSGTASACVPSPTSIEVAPISAFYGAGSYRITARLLDAAGEPLAGKPVRLTQNIVPYGQMAPAATLVTDAAGQVEWDAPFSATAGTYANGVYAWFEGDLDHAHSTAGSVTVVVQKGVPVITWAQPAPITYPARLDEVTLNATMDVPGNVWYDPDFGQVLHPGIRTITAHAGPYDWRNYGSPTLSREIEVRRGIPNVTITGGTFTYDGQPHSATASATEYRGLPLGPVTITYDGSPDAPVAAGVYTATASFPGDADHEPRSVSATITIQKRNAFVTFAPSPLAIPYDGQPHAVTATFSGIGVSFGQRPVTYDGAPTPPVNAGTYVVAATFEGDANHNAYAATTILRINPAVPSVTIGGGPFVYDGQSHPAVVTVTGLAGETVPGPLTVTYGLNGSSGTTPPVNSGYHYVQASVAAAGNYAAASATGAVTIGKAPVTITVVADPVTYDGQVHYATVTATGGGGIPIAVAVTYNGLNTTPVTAGTYAVHASYNGNGNHEAASADATLVIAKASPSCSWPAPPAITYPTALSATQQYAACNASGTLAYAPAAGTVLEPGSHTLTATFTSSDPNRTDGSVSTTLTVLRATPIVRVTGGTFYYDGQPHSATGVSATGVGGAALTPVSVTYDGSPEPPVDAGTYAVVATFDGDTYHAPATATATITINKWYPTISWNPQWFFTYGTPLGAAHLNATANVPGTFTYTPAAGTVLEASAPSSRSIQLTFVPDDTRNYLEKTLTASVYVYKASPMMRATGGTFVHDGQPHVGGGSATGVGGVVLSPVTVTYNDSPDLPVAAGTYTVRASYPGDSNYNAGSALATLTIARASTVASWTPPAAIRYGTPLGAAQLNATANVPGTFSYSPAAGTVLAPGSWSVTATFTPTDGQNYNGTTITQTVLVERALAAVSVTGGSFAYDGQPHPAAVSATGAGGVALTPVSVSYNGSGSMPVGAGTYAVVATFAGDANHEAASATATITVLPAPLVVRTIDAVKAYGAPLPAFTASFTGLVAGDTPASLTGALAFATTATAASPVGTYAVAPGGLSSPNYAIAFVNGTLGIDKAPVTVTISASPEPSGIDMPITLTATVAAAQSAPTAPTGTVRFFDGATLLGAASLSGGTATLVTGGLAAGSRTIEARYDGDAAFLIGSRTAAHVVATTGATPAIALASSRQPASTGQSVTFTASITVATTGTIQFYDGATLLGSASIASGLATFTTSSLAAGSHAVWARFTGTAGAPPAFSPVFVQAVNGSGWKDRTSTLALVSSANPSALGTTVTFTATASGSSGTPTGRILFLVDGFVVGDPTGVAMTNGQAAVSIATFGGGRHKVTATYLGNSNYRGSNGALTQTVN